MQWLLFELLTDEEVDEKIREAVWHFQADFSAICSGSVFGR